jgi:UDP-2,4-diacetamido-2,4,6-trideoxy-beta-L-altropyranose hydrolase
MTSAPRAIFRCDASTELGSGHVMRCLTLAHGLVRTGWECVFAVNPEAVVTVAALSASGFPVSVLPCGLADQAAALIEAHAGGCDLLVVDHYKLDARFETLCRPWAKRILVIDDLADRPHDCDILLDQTFGRDAADYGGLVARDCRCLMGTDYALLRPQFARERLLGSPRTEGVVRRILVSLGGTDPYGLTDVVLQGLELADLDVDIDVVLGAPSRSLVDGTRVQVHQAVQDMASLIAKADLAVGASGSSAWERCCLGLPSILVISANNQRLTADRLVEAGVAHVVGDWTSVTPESISKAISFLVHNAELYRAMSRAALKICDGLGAGRVIAALGAPDGVALCRAVADDCDLIFRWQTEPGARALARNPRPPTYQEHCAWYSRMLDDSHVAMNIILLGKAPVGVIRADRLPSGNMEVSILISGETRGRGVATAALRSLADMLPEVDLVAEIHPQNAASLAAFRAANFVPYEKNRFIRRYAASP